MKGWNIKQLSLSALLVALLFIIVELFSLELFDTGYSRDSIIPDIPRPNPNTPQIDYSQILERLETLEPEPEVVSNSPASEQSTDSTEAEPEKILKPRYAMFDDNSQIGLVGIFKEKNYFAVLQLIEFSSSKASYQRLSEGEQLGPYTLTEIGAHSVVLSAEDKQLSLSLFEQTKL